MIAYNKDDSSELGIRVNSSQGDEKMIAYNSKAYRTYLRYKTVIELLNDSEMTVRQIQQKTNLPFASVYKIVSSLLEEGVVIRTSYRLTGMGRKESLVTLKDGKSLVGGMDRNE